MKDLYNYETRIIKNYWTIYYIIAKQTLINGSMNGLKLFLFKIHNYLVHISNYKLNGENC